MAISNVEWWVRAAITAEVIPVGDRLKEAVGLMAANAGRVILNLVDPPYPTADGKPLKFTHYPPGEGKLIMTAEELQKLL